MPFTIQSNVLILFLLLAPVIIYAQTNNLTGSPYSLFGLGVSSDSGVGYNSGFTNIGIARIDEQAFNNLNPANIVGLELHHVSFDLGANIELDLVSDSSNDEARLSGNFSSFAMGISLSENWAAGFTLSPATNVGYSLVGLTTQIEGSSDEFTSNIIGSGGINDISFYLGYRLSPKLSVGGKASYLFGRIEETELAVAGWSTLNIHDVSMYRNFRFGFGANYTFTNKINIGTTIALPVALDGTQDRVVHKTLDGVPAIEESFFEEPIEDFNLPMEIGFGMSYKISNSLSLYSDFKKLYWNETDQSDKIGDYKDQQIYGMAVQYVPHINSLDYWKRVNYRFGAKYDSGYLSIEDDDVSNINFSAGIGFPIRRGGSMINLAYNFTRNGSSAGVLVTESIHTLSLNITLIDIWFQKRYLD